MTAAGVSFRPVETGDEGFLRLVYASSREAEMHVVPWSGAQKAAFLEQQFVAQHRYYHEVYPDAWYDLILLEGTPIGRLYVHRSPEELRVIDIALLPEHRGHGIGGAIMRDLQKEAASAGRKVTIHVEAHNPAQRLYRRLGFVEVADQGVYRLLEWRQDQPGAA